MDFNFICSIIVNMQLEYNEVTISLPKPPSLNQWYAGKHWAARKKQKEDFNKGVEEELEKIDLFTMERFSIAVDYNCRYDVDNCITSIKFLADCLRSNGYVVDDNPKYFFSQSITFNPELKKNEFKATIRCYGYSIRK